MRAVPHNCMKRTAQALCLLLLSVGLLVLQGCGCGFDCNNGNNPGNQDPASFTLGFTDEALEELKQVVVEVEQIAFTRNVGGNIIVENFTIDELGITDAESFQVDLLQYRGLNQLLVIENLELAAQTYSGIELTILKNDINRSYVQESDDSLKQLNISGSTLRLPGMDLGSNEQAYTAVFSLAQALQYQQGSDTYLLATSGLRTQDNRVAASLTGRVDNSLFDTESPCDAKEDPELGNRVYIYKETGLSAAALGDVFTSSSSTDIPDGKIAPFSVATLAEDVLTGNWQYAFGFLPAGDYTVAFSCDTQDDDPVDFDDFDVPLPSDQVYEVSLNEGEKGICDLDEGASC